MIADETALRDRSGFSGKQPPAALFLIILNIVLDPEYGINVCLENPQSPALSVIKKLSMRGSGAMLTFLSHYIRLFQNPSKNAG